MLYTIILIWCKYSVAVCDHVDNTTVVVPNEIQNIFIYIIRYLFLAF